MSEQNIKVSFQYILILIFFLEFVTKASYGLYKTAGFAQFLSKAFHAVSYTHLTLPTIYSV